MISEMSNVYQYLNPEINEAIEKLYLNINLNSKDQKEKGILELHKTFLQRLSKCLEKNNILEVSDLILDKSIKISDVTENYDWPTAESLKVPNLFRNTNLLYVYVKTRLNMLTGKGKKMAKDGAAKAVDNLVKILNAIIDDNITLDNNLIYICFEDLFSFYCLSNFDEKCKEAIEDLISLYNEESNISGLAKMENIDKIAEGNFFKGALSTLLQFKLDIIGQKKDLNLTDIENIFKHENVLRNSSLLLNVNFVWIYSCYKFINETNTDTDFKLCQTCMELFKISKNFKQFLLPNKSNFISVVSKHIEKLRSLIIIYYLHNSIKLTDSLFLVLDYDQRFIEELKSTSNNNLFPIIKMIKNNNVKDYNLFKFDQAILKKLEENKTDKISNELRDKYNELILKKEKKINEKDIKNNEDYLKIRLTEANKRYIDLLNF
jgi:hypothetical protein